MYKEKEIMKRQLDLSVPSAFDYVLTTLISMVDVFAISFLGSEAVAAIGAMTSVIFFYNLIIKSIQVSNNVIVAREIGKNNLNEMKISTGNAVFLTIIAQFICILIILIFGNLLPRLFKVSYICLTYLYIRLIGSIPYAITFIITGHERANGRSKQMLYIRVLSLILNIVLDYIAIKLNYGVAGVAWATVIIEFINMILVMISANKTIKYKYNKISILNIINLAKHAIIDRIFDRGGKLILDIILSRLGTFQYAAHVILNQIEAFANDFCYGFGIGITNNVGIELGKENKGELQIIKKVINKVINYLTIIIPSIILLTSILLLPILLKESQALNIAYELLPFVVIYAILMPIKYKYSSIMEGMKEFKFTAHLSFFVNIIKIVLAYILSKYMGIKGVWLTFIIIYGFISVILKNRIIKSKIFDI